MNRVRLLAAALALVVPAALGAVPADAAAASGCAARTDLEHRVVVRTRPVTTRDGERFGVLRFHAGVTFDAPQDAPGSGDLVPAWCLDLVVARPFVGRTPRDRGRVTFETSSAQFAGRASTGVLAAGGGSDLEGQHVRVGYVVDGRTIRARRVMRLVYPQVCRSR